jgi:hypothetical protein
MTRKVIDFAVIFRDSWRAGTAIKCRHTQRGSVAMSTINETVANYIAAWNEADAGRRRESSHMHGVTTAATSMHIETAPGTRQSMR